MYIPGAFFFVKKFRQKFFLFLALEAGLVLKLHLGIIYNAIGMYFHSARIAPVAINEVFL